MLVSAPFDDWWHNAYGLDVKIISPPHMVLALGMIGIQVGALVLILGFMNRASEERRPAYERLFLYIGGSIVTGLLAITMESTFRSAMHSAFFYRWVALVVPIVLVGIARASGHSFAATAVAGVYTAFSLAMLWILPLFPAEPKLGPVYQQVTHFIPWEFPILIVAPALALDWLRPRVRDRGAWTQSALFGVVFLAVLVAVQWPFANFLMTAAARNWFFGAHYMGYDTYPTSRYARFLFIAMEPTARQFWSGMVIALGTCVLMTRAGLAWADWMRRIRR
jgi:hypothetical protein